MTAKPENHYIDRVHKELPASIHREKTHNRFRRGMPDVYYEGIRGSLWVEYKWQPQRVQSLDVSGLLTPLQQRWLRRAANNQQQVAVILGTPHGGVILPGLAWETPLDSPRLLPLSEIRQWIMNKTIT